MINIEIFSYSGKYRPLSGIPKNPNFLFDCRGVTNPGRIAHLKPQTGLDREVVEWLEQNAGANAFFTHVCAVLDPAVQAFSEGRYGDMVIGFACTGGQHRSVYFAEKLKTKLADGRFNVTVKHFDVDSHYSAKEVHSS